MFHSTKDEEDLDQINEIKMVMYTVLERMDSGVYPPFPRILRM